MGQGVDKSDGKITFIAKTLPGETGTARVLKAKKGVQFAKLDAIEKTSDSRVESSCAHFSECPGCQYLHTDYQSELSFKKEALLRALQKTPFDHKLLKVAPSPQRDAYRNRIQLHYRDDKIGLIDGLTDSLVEIPGCQIIRQELQPAFSSLYEDNTWQQSHTGRGHCELYLKDGEVNLTWDKPYSHGGFTQVNESMNDALKQDVEKLLTDSKPKSVLDLFCGDGNLSNRVTEQLECKRIMIDSAGSFRHGDFVQLDLLKDNALAKFRREHQRNSFDALVLDPPRAGFKNLPDWTAAFEPKTIVYVSCAPATLARDLANISEQYAINSVTLLDMFPGTHHFETVVALSRR